MQNFRTLKLLKKTFEEWTPKLAAIISTVSAMISTSMDRLCPKDVIKEMTDVEQILSDRQRWYWKWIYKEGLGCLIGYTKETDHCFKNEKENTNGKPSDLNNFFLVDLQKWHIKTWRTVMWWDKKSNPTTIFVWTEDY